MISSTPLRKSYNRKLNDSISCTPVESAVDDDSERRQRRSVYNVERQRLNISESSNLSAPADVDQMKNHIMMCQKLFVQNKISIRNAWDIKVIEYIHHYVSTIQIDSESLVVAAMTLDVCVKVHGCRIEYIAQEINKLLTAQAAAAVEKGDNAPDEELCDEANEANNNKNTKNKRKRKRITTTVVKDSSAVCSDISKIASTHFTGNIDIYANNFENMFTQKMPMDHSAYHYNSLHDGVCGFLSYDTKDIPIKKTLIPVINSKITHFAICPEFKTFNVDENDADSNNSIVDMMTDDNASRIHEVIANEVVYDEDGAPVPELDGSTHDIFADDNEIHDTVEENQPIEHVAPRRIEMITSFCPAEKSAQTLARSTLSQNFLETLWVGPSHWKNKLIRPSVPRYSGKPEEKVPHLKTKKRNIRPKPAPINLDDLVEIDFTKKCITKRISYNIKKVTLPPNILSIIPDCDKLILRDFRPTKEFCAPRRESEYEHSPYDYGNADDSQYCSQIELPDINDDHEQENFPNDAMEEDKIEEVICANAQNNLNMTRNLIDVPDMVTQTYIPYASRAKRLNMKKVKNAILNCLTKVTVSKENKADIGNIEPASLSTIYKTLPSKLSKKDRKEISIHLTFFCLLHLANDYDLSLSGNEILNDVTISKP